MSDLDTEQLIQRAKAGDFHARESLLTRHRARLRRMIGVYLDPRLSARVDPSDIIQEALTCAAAGLPRYLEDRPIAFYPWLRQFVHNSLADIHRRHVVAQRRTIGREQRMGSLVSDASAMQLADRLVSHEQSPSQQMHVQELRDEVKRALSDLSTGERELLMMRFAEQLSVGEISETLEITQTAARSRITRALQKLSQQMRTD